MADSTRPTIDRIWANDADPVNVVEPSTAKQDAGWGAEKPPFQSFNWFWQKLCNLLSSNEKNGILPWRSTTSYALNGLCMGSDGRIYQSQQAANANHEPIGDNGTWWKDWIDRVSDVEYVAFTGTTGTPAITQTTNGTYTYTLADLVGSGLVHSEIRAIYLKVVHSNSNRSMGEYFSVTFPDGTSHQISSDTGNSTSGGYEGDVVCVPINKLQTSISVTMQTASGAFTIIGATQRTS